MKKILTLLCLAVLLSVSCSKDDGPDKPAKEVIPDKCEYAYRSDAERIPDELAATAVVNAGPYKSFTVKDIYSDPDGSVWGRVMRFILPPCEAFPDGLCAKLSRRQHNDDGTDTIFYSECALEDVFEKLDLQACGDLVPHVTQLLDGDGNEIPFKVTKAVGKDRFVIDIPSARLRNWDETVIFQINSGRLELDMLLTAVIDDCKLRYFGAKLNPTIDLDIDMEANVQKSFTDSKHPFLTVICAAYPVGPVIITPLIEISFIIGAEGKVALTAGLKYKQECRLTAICDNGEFDGKIEAVPDDSDGEVITFKNTTTYTEADIFAGFDYSAGIGVFGTALYATLGVQEKIKCGGKFIADLEKWSKDPYNSMEKLFTYYADSKFYVDYAYNGVAALNTFGGKVLGQLKGAEVSEHIDSSYFLPKLEVALKEQSDAASIVEITASHKTIWPYEIGYNFYQQAPGDSYYALMSEDKGNYDGTPSRYSLGEFNLPAGKESKTFTESVYPDENAKCRVRPFFTFQGKDYVFPISYGAYFTHEGKALKVFKEIAADIADCLEGELPENWGTTKPLTTWKGITISKMNDVPYMEIDMSDLGGYAYQYAFKLKPTLKVGDHSAGNGEYLWSIQDIPEGTELELLEVTDKNFFGFDFGTSQQCVTPGYGLPIHFGVSLKNVKVHSEKLALMELSPQLETLEIKNSQGIKGLHLDADYTGKVKSVTLDNLKIFESFYVDRKAFDNGPVSVKISNCPALTDLDLLQEVSSTSELLNSLSGQKLETLTIYSTELASLNRAAVSGDISLYNCKIGSLSVSADCKSINTSMCTIGDVALSKCPSLEKLNLYACKMTSFSVDDLPNAKFVDISGAHINSVIPPVFDSIRAATGGNFNYDVKYQYYSSTHWAENAYGWWYEGEPDRGYHLQTE